MAPKNIKLHYFEITGRAEPIRLCFRYGDIKFEDVRFSHQQWAELKPKFPFGQVPVLEVDGVMIPQTAAILRYAATLAKLYPSDPYEALLVDSVVSTIESDFFALIGKFRKAPEAEKGAISKTLIEVDFPSFLTKFDAYLAKIAKGPFITSSVSVADLMTYQVLKELPNGYLASLVYKPGETPESSSKYKTLAKIEEAVANLPKIRALTK